MGSGERTSPPDDRLRWPRSRCRLNNALADPLGTNRRDRYVSEPISRPTTSRRPKRGGGHRTFTRLDPGSAQAYRAAVDHLEPAILGAIGDGSIAERRTWGQQRIIRTLAIRKHELSPAASAPVGVTDVAGFFSEVTPALAEHSAAKAGAPRAERHRLRAILERFQEAGVVGLPIGPAPSALVAEAVLAPIDQLLDRARVPYIRWVDDIAVGGSDPGAALRIIAESLSSLGLHHHPAKTRIMTTREFHETWVRGLSYHRPDANAL